MTDAPTMKAIVCTQFGPPEDLVLRDVPAPVPGPGQVHIRVRAASLNFADTLVIQGKYQEKPPFPFTPGFECAGEVIGTGEGVKHYKPGMKVIALAPKGAFCEEVVTDAASVLPLPEGLGFAEGSAFPVAYGTSHIGLVDRGQLKAGETLLVLGAGGGVGLTAVEIGKALGARVIAAASGPDKLAAAREAGADETIDYTAEDLKTRVKELAPKGVDVVYDPVGGELFDAALRCMAWDGRIVVVGFAGGTIPQIPANLLLVKQIAVTGVYWGAHARNNPKRLASSLMELLGMVMQGKLKPKVNHAVPFAEYVAAFRLLMDRKATGKVVLTL